MNLSVRGGRAIGGAAPAGSRWLAAARGGAGIGLIELLIVVAIIATLAGIIVPLYSNMQAAARIARAVADIQVMSVEIDGFNTAYGRYPSNLGEIGRAGFLDPWDNPYRFLNIRNDNPPPGHMRKDRSLVPINSDYDLYSMGPDGQSVSPLTAAHSRDDIVRAGDGGYVGVATGY
jgi:general secretion pathway protein G